MAAEIDSNVEKAADEFRGKFAALKKEIGKAIVGHKDVVEGVLTALFVGGHVLIGLCGGVMLQLLLRAYYFVPKWLGNPLPRPETIWPDTLLGPRYYISEFLAFQENSVFLGFALLFLLLVVQFLLRSEWLAVAVVVGLGTAIWYGEVSTVYPLVSLIVTALRMVGFVLILKRCGVLALIVAIYFDSLLNTFPITTALSEWYAEASIFVLVVVMGLGAYALYAAAGGRHPRPTALS